MSKPHAFSRRSFRTPGVAALIACSVTAALVAQGRQGAARGAAPAAAGGPMPTVVVGGIQVVKAVIAGDDFSAKPFNSDNGTKLVLWVKMPAGQGLIELDEDTSLLQHFGDDKGMDLGGKFGSFPEEFKDGTGGTIDIQSNAVPGAGATALVAQGTLSMSIATGTRPVRVANVRLEDDRKFNLGNVSVTVADVKTDGDEETFSLHLPRQTMIGIKDVKFLDAKGEAIEGRRTGTGYMNDAGEMDFTVKSNAKTMTLEFEMWQGLRTIKVPFNVKSGIALGGS